MDQLTEFRDKLIADIDATMNGIATATIGTLCDRDNYTRQVGTYAALRGVRERVVDLHKQMMDG